MYYPRALKTVWLEASEQFPVLLLTGPRQAGKTTFLQHLCKDKRAYVTLDDPAIRSLAIEEPSLFMNRFEPPVLIDEIQYAPNLMPYIKMAVDTQNKQGQYWLTGSQQFVMMKGISETLAGRVAILNMLGFCGRERYQRLSESPFLPQQSVVQSRNPYVGGYSLKKLYHDIWLGSFPALATGKTQNRELYFSSYLQTYLQRDVKDLTQVGNELSFIKFVRACAARTGQQLNLSDIAKDTDISVTTAKNWLSILQASFQIYLLQPYHSNLTKRMIKTPKLYFLDTGLCSYLTEWDSPQTLEAGAMSGAILETYILSEILKSYWYCGLNPSIYYYRDKEKREIDFILEQNQTLYPIEVKKSADIRKEWVESFSVLDKLKKPVGDGAVICSIDTLMPIDKNNNAIPVSML